MRAPYHRLCRLTISLLLVLSCAAPAASAAEGDLPRVASISTCADQVLVEIADPDQIVGLSAFATDPGISFSAKKAEAYPTLGISAEELLKLRPDVVFASPYLEPEMRGWLERFGMEVVTMGLSESIDSSNAEILEIAEAIGQEERGRRLVERIEAALAQVRGTAGGDLSALQLQRRGFVAGTDTLLSDLLSRFGVASAASELGVRALGRVDLETLLKLAPDVVVMSSLEPEAPDQGAALLRHPALREAYPPEKRIVMPGNQVVCGGPPILAAIDTLKSELARIRGTGG